MSLKARTSMGLTACRRSAAALARAAGRAVAAASERRSGGGSVVGPSPPCALDATQRIPDAALPREAWDVCGRLRAAGHEVRLLEHVSPAVPADPRPPAKGRRDARGAGRSRAAATASLTSLPPSLAPSFPPR